MHPGDKVSPAQAGRLLDEQVRRLNGGVGKGDRVVCTSGDYEGMVGEVAFFRTRPGQGRTVVVRLDVDPTEMPDWRLSEIRLADLMED